MYLGRRSSSASRLQRDKKEALSQPLPQAQRWVPWTRQNLGLLPVPTGRYTRFEHCGPKTQSPCHLNSPPLISPHVSSCPKLPSEAQQLSSQSRADGAASLCNFGGFAAFLLRLWEPEGLGFQRGLQESVFGCSLKLRARGFRRLGFRTLGQKCDVVSISVSDVFSCSSWVNH